MVLSGGLVLLCVLPQRQRVSVRLVAAVIFSVLAIAIWMLVAWTHFGVGLGSIREALRLASYLAVLVIAYRAAQAKPESLTAFLGMVAIIPAVVLIVGYVASWQPTLNVAGRAVGSFSHANAAASYFGITTIASIAQFWRTRRRLMIVSGALSGVALVLTQSLGNIIGVALGVALLILLNSQFSLARRLLLITLAAAAALTLFFTLGASNRLTELDGTNFDSALASGVSGNSLEWRVINWQLLLDLWWDKSPLVGFGLGSTSTAIMPLGAPPHSLPVQILVETGLIGFTAAVGLLAVLFAALRRRATEHRVEVALVGALVAFILLSGSTSNLIGYTAAGYVVFLIIGSILGASRAVKSSPNQINRPARRVPV
jgi:O-antigen ligase